MYHSTNVRQGPGSIDAPAVKANALLYAHFERPDLNRGRDYLVDFGLLVVSQGEDELFLRGTGSTPYIYRVSRGDAARFIGFGLSVSSADDLKTLAKASRRLELSPALSNKRRPAATGRVDQPRRKDLVSQRHVKRGLTA